MLLSGQYRKWLSLTDYEDFAEVNLIIGGSLGKVNKTGCPFLTISEFRPKTGNKRATMSGYPGFSLKSKIEGWLGWLQWGQPTAGSGTSLKHSLHQPVTITSCLRPRNLLTTLPSSFNVLDSLARRISGTGQVRHKLGFQGGESGFCSIRRQVSTLRPR